MRYSGFSCCLLFTMSAFDTYSKYYSNPEKCAQCITVLDEAKAPFQSAEVSANGAMSHEFDHAANIANLAQRKIKEVQAYLAAHRVAFKLRITAVESIYDLAQRAVRDYLLKELKEADYDVKWRWEDEEDVVLSIMVPEAILRQNCPEFFKMNGHERQVYTGERNRFDVA